ncbi:putative baseplate assembly protein [Streptomyces sp. NPDC002688]|uniref:putative baseplate assembly protein n=1 Tax=Streptomyces sp. NPDC002688 TaxID=3154423 RepID=UPI0033249D60
MTDPLPHHRDRLPATGQPEQSPVRVHVTAHGQSLARMRAALASPAQPVGVRALARRPPDEPAIALLDSWAVVADIVAFYTKRVAQEGFLSTATERESVRELTRTLGHELRPGVAAQAELAFTVEQAPGAPQIVTVPQGAAVQSVPGPGQTPQIFETGADLECRAVWNSIPAIATVPQLLGSRPAQIWVEGTASAVQAGDPLLILTHSNTGRPSAVWAFLVVTHVAVQPPGHPGWTLLSVALAAGTDCTSDTLLLSKGHVHRFAQRAPLSGWNAPPGAPAATNGGTAAPRQPGQKLVLELDGDQLRVLPGSWLVVECAQPADATGQTSPAQNPGGGQRRLYRAVSASPSIKSHNGFSTPITVVRTDGTQREFDARNALVHCQSVELATSRMPRTDPVLGRRVELAATKPELPPGRMVVIQGQDVRTGAMAAEQAEVVDCTVDPTGTIMTVTLDRKLKGTYAPATVALRGNVVPATHGETLSQVLGSGNGEQRFTALPIWRGPLTYVRTAAQAGAQSTLNIRVHDELWREVPTLREAGPNDRAYVVRNTEDGMATAVFGDGVRGARLPTGTENVTASYRVGIGADGDIAAGQLSLLPRRPLGIATVDNPAAAHDWAPPETLEDARGAAPRRARTLDRVVSVGDYEDFALGFAGISTARADLVLDGSRRTTVVSVTGERNKRVSEGLLADLTAAFQDVCPPGAWVRVLPADILWFGVRVGVLVDPAHERPAVARAVGAALEQRFAPERQRFGTPVTAAAVTTTVQGVPGVLACDLPRLLRLPDVAAGAEVVLPPDTEAVQVLASSPAHQSAEGICPAQLVGLARGAVEVGAMPQ